MRQVSNQVGECVGAAHVSGLLLDYINTRQTSQWLTLSTGISAASSADLRRLNQPQKPELRVS